LALRAGGLLDAERDTPLRGALVEALIELRHTLERGKKDSAELARAESVLDEATRVGLVATAEHPAEDESAPALESTAAIETRTQDVASSESVARRDSVGSAAPLTSPDPSDVDANPPAETHAGRTATLPGDLDDDLLASFLAESKEHCVDAEEALMMLEDNPSDSEAINHAFRCVHSVKGTSAFFGLTQLTDFAHDAENVLSLVRTGALNFTSSIAQACLRSVDIVRGFLSAVENAQEDRTYVIPDTVETVRAELLRLAQGEHPVAAPAPILEPPTSSPAGPVPAPEATTANNRNNRKDRSVVRVHMDRLDGLLAMIEELVIAQSMLRQEAALHSASHPGLRRKALHVGKIVRELHDVGMSLRMVPLRDAFQRIRRLVRDVSLQCEKEVSLQTEGDETEIDRNMVDALQDPLVHLVRNAIDHGLEVPAERRAAGKPPRGEVRLAARSQGGKLIVTLSDDGRGLDRARIVAKAVERKLIDNDDGMSDHDVFSLIFSPGFSTAARVTEVSGRGVGMDVVRKNIEALRGRIDIHSTPGSGTTFQIHIPLTLALTDGMLLRVRDHRYIIPTVDIITSFRPRVDQLSTIAQSGRFVTVLGRVVPIVSLAGVFGIDTSDPAPHESLLVVINCVEKGELALMVDELIGQQQVVAKPLCEGVGRTPGIAGSAILPDGRVGLILDPTAISNMALQTHIEGAAVAA
ncbi:MAG: chemotaxis protein CheA, partial [Myxococcales bacterium FL481]